MTSRQCSLSKHISKSWNESLPIHIFLRNKISGKWRWTGAVGFRTKILQGEEISSVDENDSAGGVFTAKFKPPKSITGES